jgi:serine protease Do
MKRVMMVIALACGVCLAAATPYAATDLKKLSDELAALATKVQPSVVAVEVESPAPQVFTREAEAGGVRLEIRAQGQAGSGPAVRASGVIVSSDGCIVTSADVLRGNPKAEPKVTLSDGRTFTAKVVGRDARTRLAVLKIDATNLPAVTFADKLPPVGSLVVAAGAGPGNGPTYSLGVLDGTDRAVAGEGYGPVGTAMQYTGLLAITNPVNPGDAGGLLTDVDGRLIGILHSSLTDRAFHVRPLNAPRGQAMPGMQVFGFGPFGAPEMQGFSVATPVDVVKPVVDTLRRGEKVEWGFLGLYFQAEQDQGLRVTDVVADGPAAKAGIRKDDVLKGLAVPGKEPLKISGTRSDVVRFQEMVGLTKPGTDVTLTLTRNGEEKKVAVKLGVAPEPAEQEALFLGPNWEARGPLAGAPVTVPGQPVRPQPAWLGVQLQDTPDGVRVAEVLPGSPAERFGLRADDLITKVEGKNVTKGEEVAQAVESHKLGQALPLTIRRGKEEIQANVELTARPLNAAPQIDNRMREMIERMREGVTFLGVEAEDTDQGVKVTRVIEGSPAQKAGMKVGDVVSRAGGKEIAMLSDLRDVVRWHKPGDVLDVEVKRGNEQIDLKATLTRQPETMEAPPGYAPLPGATVPGGPMPGAAPNEIDALRRQVREQQKQIEALKQQLQKLEDQLKEKTGK